jgi:hypothetical protein
LVPTNASRITEKNELFSAIEDGILPSNDIKTPNKKSNYETTAREKAAPKTVLVGRGERRSRTAAADI